MKGTAYPRTRGPMTVCRYRLLCAALAAGMALTLLLSLVIGRYGMSPLTALKILVARLLPVGAH